MTRHACAFLLLASLAAMATPATPAAAAPLSVVSAAPQGVLEGGEQPRIQIIFSHAVVALGAAEVLTRPPAWLTVEPPIAARWRWAGTAELIGEPITSLPAATAYTVTIRAGVRAGDGAVLDAPFTFAFQTAAPAAEIAVARDEDESRRQDGDSRDLLAFESAIEVTFNQPVDPGSLDRLLSVRAAPRPLPGAEGLVDARTVQQWQTSDPAAWTGWKSFLAAAQGASPATPTFDLKPDAERPFERFLIRPAGCWPAAATIEVEIAAGLRSLSGPVPGVATRATLTTPWPFAPLGFDGRTATAGGGLDPAEVQLRLSTEATWRDLAPYLSCRETGSGRAVAATIDEDSWVWTAAENDLRLWPFAFKGGAGYEVCLAPGAMDSFGQTLGFPWCRTVETAHFAPSFYLVEGDGVVEFNGPHLLPLRSLNVTTYSVTHRRIAENELVAALKKREGSSDETETAPTAVTLPPIADRAITTPIDLDAALGGTPGIVWSQLQVDAAVAGSEYHANETAWLRRPRTTLTQVTSLGLTVKASGQAGILVWVTELQPATPVPGAEISIRDSANRVIWSGVTDAAGLARTPDEIGLARAFVVTARRGDDLAYARTRWWDGHRGWEFNLPVDDGDRPPVTGLVFTDRGVVRPGERLHVKALVRRQGNRQLTLPAESKVTVLIRNSRDEEVLAREVTIDASGAAETEFEIPAAAPLGNWQVEFGTGLDSESRRFEGDKAWSVAGSFRVAEFRRPKFRVAIDQAAERLTAGDPLVAAVHGTLLAGPGMGRAATTWVIRASRQPWHPDAARWSGYDFMPGDFSDQDGEEPRQVTIAEGEGVLDDRGVLEIRIPRVESLKGWPARLEIEAEVQDLDRQSSAATAVTAVAAGEFALGVQRPQTFVQASAGVATAVIALSPDGAPRTGVAIKVELKRQHWESVRRREVSGRFVYESRPVVTTVETREVVSAAEPIDVRFSLAESGEYLISAIAVDSRSNSVAAACTFYVFGSGFAPWRMDEENRVSLVAEHDTWTVGETAHILVKSPWERALALVTVERAGVLEARIEPLAGTMATISVPILPSYAPNVFVSVVLLRGRIDASATAELIDPGRPAYRVGYCELTVPPSRHRLGVTAHAARDEIRPGQTATVDIEVKGADGAGVAAAVTVWAVDAGVLDLTAYRTPDPFATFYARRGLGVSTAESRSRLIGRRSYGSKGDKPGGGGGIEAGGAAVRRDFRALAVWRGDVTTDSRGRATVSFPVPESLTTYRLMVVAAAGEERFGSGETEFRVSKPLGIEPALPRFLRPDDKARAAVVIRNRTTASQQVEVTLALPADGVVRLRGTATRVATVAAGSSAEVGFGLLAVAPGTALLRFTATATPARAERDAVEVPLAVIAARPSETVATFFRVDGHAREAVKVPDNVFPATGGLEVRLASSAALEAEPGVRFLARYPWGCAEQLASRLLGLTAAVSLGQGFAPDAVDSVPRDAWFATTAGRLVACQRGDGGFAYWPDALSSSTELSAHVAWALQAARETGVAVEPAVIDRAARYLAGELRRVVWPSEPSYAWTVRIMLASALARLDKAEPAFYQALFDERTTRWPLWPRAVLAEAMLRTNSSDPRAAVLLQEIRNALAAEARGARLEDRVPEWGWRVWWSDERGSAAALLALVRGEPGSPIADRLARSLAGRLARNADLTTQETAWALQALAAHEGSAGRAGLRTGRITLGTDHVLDASFPPATAGADSALVAMPRLQELAGGRQDRTLDLVATSEGGALHAAAILQFARRGNPPPPLAQGLAILCRILDGRGRPTAGVGAGEEVTVEIAVDCPATRRFVVAEVPLPAGLEALDPRLATTARRGAEDDSEELDRFWRPGFDHVDLRDDRIVLFATELPAGTHRTTVRCRATTAGTFLVAAPRVEEMYAPELFGTGSATTFEIAAPARP